MKQTNKYGTPEGLPTPEQMWAKLSGSTSKLTLEELRKRLKEIKGGKR